MSHPSAHEELQGRLKTITNEIARRMESRDALRAGAVEEDATITALLQLHDQYQTIIGRSTERTVTVKLKADTIEYVAAMDKVRAATDRLKGETP